MDTELKKAYVIYECWNEKDDVGAWMYDRNIPYSIRVSINSTIIPTRLHHKKDNNSWAIYSAYLTGEEVTIIGLTFINTVVTEAKEGPDVRTLIYKVIEKMV